jgi:hypothetical protein
MGDHMTLFTLLATNPATAALKTGKCVPIWSISTSPT